MKKLALQELAVASMLGLGVAAAQGQERRDPLNYAVTSWGDVMWVHGPGTYPSMSSPEMVEKMIEHWKGRGYTGVTMRTDLGQFEPFIRRNPIPDDPRMAASSGISNPRVATLLHYVDTKMLEFDVHKLGSELGAKHGFEWWAWHPHVYSDGAPETAGAPGLGRIWPWSYVYKYEFENQEVITVDRAGTKLWMAPEYGYPGLRKAKVDEVVYMAKTFGIKNFLICMRSELTQLIDAPSHADQFGFNGIVVEDMKRLYGVDIMTDPRFDWTSPTFDSNDEMVNKWRDLRGTYITAYYRELRAALRELDPNIKLGVTLSGDHVGPPLGNWRLDWRTWVDEGLVDMIVAPVFFEATLDHEAGKKGYLTHAREGKGTVSAKQLREHIAKSKHPEIKVLQTGGAPYVVQDLPPGADGWRTDTWASSYTLAWYQRWWQHWMKDVKELGSISFFRQNFNDFPIGSSGHARGWGDGRYDPETRTSTGVWYHLGDGTDARPHAVQDIVRGETGRSMKLTRAQDGRSNLTGYHFANPDRSNFTNGLDTSITNGVTTFSWWVYRPDEGGGLSAYLQDTGAEMDVALKVAPGTGLVSYSTGREVDHGKWVATEYAVPVGQWAKLTLVADLDRKVYSGFAGDNNEVRLCKDVAVEMPKSRTIMQNGVNLPIEVPVFKAFKALLFVPEGKVDTSTYLDDVAVDWTPTLHYAEPGSIVGFEDDFEKQRVDDGIAGKSAQSPGRWEVASKAPDRWFVTNDTSFGAGVRSLFAESDGRLVAHAPRRVTADGGTMTLDLDLFVRSDSSYPYMIPNPSLRSVRRVTVGIERVSDGAVLAAAHTGESAWELIAGDKASPSKTGIAYDAWNHLQVAIDPTSRTYQVVVQPLGEVPILVGSGTLNEAVAPGDPLRVFIDVKNANGVESLFDNVRLTTQESPGSAR